MIVIPRAALRVVAEAAEAAYPREACGLLVGRTAADGAVAVSRAEVAANVDDSGRPDRFEVDPRLRLRLTRELAGGPERIVGHFHSHPDAAARPSPTDLACAFEPDLVWLIVAVERGQAVHVAAHRPEPGGRRFVEIPLRTDPLEDP